MLAGSTEFNLKVISLNSHGGEPQRLVVAGDKVKFEGTATINGEGAHDSVLARHRVVGCGTVA